MFMLEPEPTPFDLHWRMFGISVRVHPLFWIVSAFLGWPAIRLGFPFVLLWIACVFVSVLIHELGHVLMGRLFGSAGHIVLYSFGGLAIGSSSLSSRWQRIAVYLAGPGAGFVLFGLVYLCTRLADPEHLTAMARVAIFDLFWINLVWGIVNLFPIYPLDGGQVSRDVLEWFMPLKGMVVSLTVSLSVAGLLAIFFVYRSVALKYDDWYEALFFAMLALGSFQALQQLRMIGGPTRTERRNSWESDRAPWEKDPDYWKK